MHHILPWQQQQWQYLLNRRNTRKLPHAILLKGMAGLGKSNFAKSLAELLLCQSSLSSDHACGACDACQLLATHNHPDLVIVQPEESGKTIKIEQIREVITNLEHTSHQGGYKIVMIESAELLNIAAANALLKTLEEPAPDTIIILISAYSIMLTATIRSRCQILAMDAPKPKVALEWLRLQLPESSNLELLLALASNAPLKALEIAQSDLLTKRAEFFHALDDLDQNRISSIQMAAQGLNWGLGNLLVTLLYIVGDLIKVKFKVNDYIVNQDQLEKIGDFAARVDLGKLFAFKDHLYVVKRHLANKINLNQQLTIESLIITWQQLFTALSINL